MTTPELPPLPRFDFDIYAGGDVEDADGVFVRFADALDRERILQARIAEAEEQRGQWAGLCVRLEARIAELEADAERYRWIRARNEAIKGIDPPGPYVVEDDDGETHYPGGAELDAAIDAARKA